MFWKMMHEDAFAPSQFVEGQHGIGEGEERHAPTLLSRMLSFLLWFLSMDRPQPPNPLHHDLRHVDLIRTTSMPDGKSIPSMGFVNEWVMDGPRYLSGRSIAIVDGVPSGKPALIDHSHEGYFFVAELARAYQVIVRSAEKLVHASGDAHAVTLRVRDRVAEILPRQRSVLRLRHIWHEQGFHLRVEQGNEPGVIEVRMERLPPEVVEVVTTTRGQPSVRALPNGTRTTLRRAA